MLVLSGGHWVLKNPVSTQAISDLRAAGFFVVDPEYRLAPGMGGECARETVPCGKIPGQTSLGRYPDQTNDLALAVAALRKDPRCNGQVFAVGGSAGAYHALFLATKGMVDAAAALSPATDLDLLVAGGGAPGDKAQNYAPGDLTEASPNTYLDVKVSHPFYLIAFSTDEMPASQFNSTVAKLGEMGPFDYKATLITGAGHSWAAWPKEGAAVVDFFKAHLGPPPTPSPTATSTPTATPTATPTPSPSSTPARPLHGVIELIAGGDQVTGLESGWTRASIAGERFRGDWKSAEPNDTKPDFANLDKFIAASKAHPGKLTGLSFRGGDSYPAWLAAAGAKFVTLGGQQIALPWDPVVVQKWSDFINLVIAHCKSLGYTPDYVVAGNIGNGLTTQLAQTPEEISAVEALGGLAKWNANADAMISLYESFGCPVIVAAAGAPYVSPAGSAALQAMIDRNAALYPNFGPMHTALRATITGEGLPFKLLRQYSTTTHPTGLQFVNSVNQPFNAPLVCSVPSSTCFSDAMATGAGYDVNFIEIYGPDDTDDNQPVIAATAQQLR